MVLCLQIFHGHAAAHLPQQLVFSSFFVLFNAKNGGKFFSNISLNSPSSCHVVDGAASRPKVIRLLLIMIRRQAFPLLQFASFNNLNFPGTCPSGIRSTLGISVPSAMFGSRPCWSPLCLWSADCPNPWTTILTSTRAGHLLMPAIWSIWGWLVVISTINNPPSPPLFSTSRSCLSGFTGFVKLVGSNAFFNAYFWTRVVAFILLPSLLLICLNALLIRSIQRCMGLLEQQESFFACSKILFSLETDCCSFCMLGMKIARDLSVLFFGTNEP